MMTRMSKTKPVEVAGIKVPRGWRKLRDGEKIRATDHRSYHHLGLEWMLQSGALTGDTYRTCYENRTDVGKLIIIRRILAKKRKVAKKKGAK